MAVHEEKHWWFAARRRVVSRVLAARTGIGPGTRALDVGCGTGGNLRVLRTFTEQVAGMEMNPVAAEIARTKSGVDVQSGRLPDAVPFAAASFDLILLTDVLEHVEADVPALERLHALLKPGGELLLTVPAFSWLWSRHDEVHHHFRRYTRAELAAKLRAAGFAIDFMSYYNFFLFLPIAMVRLIKQWLGLKDGAGDVAMPPAGVNRLLTLVMGAEASVLPLVTFPFGVSLIAVARRGAAR